MRSCRNICALFMLVVWASAILAAEGRTPVYAPGTTITNSGKYILTRNLLGTGSPVIEINTASVDLDLNGFLIDGSGGVAIRIVGANEVRIHDGVLMNVSIGIEFTSGVFRAVLEDLRILGPLLDGIRLDATNNFAIRRVLINNTGPTADGIRLANGTPTMGRIESCQIAGGGGRGIYLYNGASVAIVDNVINNMGNEGIFVDGCDACLIKENTVARSGGQGGIYLSFAKGSTVTRNLVTGSKTHGIHLGSATRDIFVEANVMRENGSASPGDGLRIDGLGGMVVGNTMNGNTGIGLHFTSTSANVTYGRNTARGNANGGGATCTGVPTLFLPDSCNESIGNTTTFGDNLIPGPPLF